MLDGLELRQVVRVSVAQLPSAFAIAMLGTIESLMSAVVADVETAISMALVHQARAASHADSGH